MAKLPSLQALRGIAANLVVTYHLFLVDEKFTGGTLPHFLYYGTAGVDVFFVLSGFIKAAVAAQNVGSVQIFVATGAADLSELTGSSLSLFWPSV